MNSMLEDVLAREGSAPAFEDSRVDAELEEMLSKMRTNIKIIGLGGGGCNTIGRVYNEGIVGAELFACNTDAQHLLHIAAPKKVLLGRRITKGLGAGALPQIGEEAAREAEEELRAIVQGADIVFVTCGLGGGTGTGSCGYVARLAKEMGALTIAVVTLQFRGEGKLRMESAEWGLERLRDAADTVITIPNDKLLDLVPRQSLNLAFKFADEVLMRSIKGLTEIITKPGLVNLDFNDVKTIMKGGGVAMIGLGESQAVGDNRAVEAIEEAINSPLLEVDVSTAHGVLINVTGGNDMTISEAERVAEVVQSKVSPTARIIWGATVDASLEHTLRVMLVATGVKSKQIVGRRDPPEEYQDCRDRGRRLQHDRPPRRIRHRRGGVVRREHGRPASAHHPVPPQAPPGTPRHARPRSRRTPPSRRGVGPRGRGRTAVRRPGCGHGVHHVRPRRRHGDGRRPGPRAALERGGRLDDRDLHVPVSGGGSHPRGERGVRPREAPELCGHGGRDPE